MKVISLIGISLLLNFLNSGTAQDTKCSLSWKRTNNSNHRNAYKVSVQPNEFVCLGECRGTPGCLAVDVDMRKLSFYVTCWFHGDPEDLLQMFPFQGVDTFIKNVTCPDGVVPGLPGAEISWNNSISGVKGQLGAQGFTGAKGVEGTRGPVGAPGVRGQAGDIGWPGHQGFSGSQGQVGIQGSTGPEGPPGLGLFVKSTCQSSWVTLSNVRSPGGVDSVPAASSRTQCQDLCLSDDGCLAVEFGLNASLCKFHKMETNLDRKIFTLGTDQMVITSRCITAGDTGFTGYFDPSSKKGTADSVGSTGATGATGLMGFAGLMGSPGPQGSQGETGPSGIWGLTGLTGDTGATGATGDTGQPGNVIHVKDQCEPKWVLVEDVTSPSSDPYPKANDLQKCMDACLAHPKCLGLNFLVSTPPCFLVTNMGNLNDKIRTFGAVHLVLVYRCPMQPDMPLKHEGNVAPLTSSDESKDTKDVDWNETPSEREWLPTLFLTLPSVLITDGVCCVLYATWKAATTIRGKVKVQGH